LFSEGAQRGARQDCLARHHDHRAPNLPELNIAGGFRAIARKKMSASKPSNELQNQVADQISNLAINRSARESHYSDRRIFCNNYLILFIDQFQLCTTCVQERIFFFNEHLANNSLV
jgi:hypothetical protein